MLEWEDADQDGYRHRAVRVWPKGNEPVDLTAEQNSTVHKSVLTLRPDNLA